MVHSPLAARHTITGPLATGAGGAAAVEWWNPDGATPAANTGAWEPKGAASLAASYINKGLLGYANIDPAVVGGLAPTFGANGWIFNGLTQYLKSGIIPTNDQTWTAIVQFANVPGAANTVITGCATGPAFQLAPNYGAIGVVYSSGSSSTFLPGMTSGNICVAGSQGYRNGAADGAAIGPFAGVFIELFIGGRNLAGALNSPQICTMQAIAFYNVTLTAPQVLARATAMSLL